MNSNISKASTGDSNINKKRVSSPKLSRLPLYNSNPNLHPGRPSSPSLIPIKGEPGGGLVFVKHYTALYSIIQHCAALYSMKWVWGLEPCVGGGACSISFFFFFSFFLWQSCASFFLFLCIVHLDTQCVSNLFTLADWFECGRAWCLYLCVIWWQGIKL